MSSSLMRGFLAGLISSVLLASCLRDAEPTQGDPGDTTPATKSVEAPKTPPAKKSRTNANMPDKAPEVFQVKFKTTAGDMVLECHREWAPRGADRFFELVKKGFYEEIAFFRVIPNFMAQFGIHGDPEQAGEWRGERIDDDPVKQSNTRGMVTFATAGPNTRTTQMFINFKNNSGLDRQGFAPFAKIVEGLENIDKIYQVGESQPRGPGPAQGLVQSQGNAYLKKDYPKLTYIKGAEYLGKPNK